MDRVNVSLRYNRDGVRMKKNLRYVAIAFVIFYLLSSPRDAAGFVNNAFTQLGRAGDQVSSFVSSLDLSP